MSVTVDDEPLAAEAMGLATVGEVLRHLRHGNRLVTNLLIDGRSPDLSGLGAIRQSPLRGHVIYIETSDPRAMALSVLDEVRGRLDEIEPFRDEAVRLLARNQPGPAMQRLSACFSAWQAAQDSVLKIARLLGIDLDRVRAGERPLSEFIGEFADQLRRIRVAVEHRDFVTLGDILTYEAAETGAGWRDALAAVGEFARSQ